MTYKEVNQAFDNSIKELKEKYPETDLFNPNNPYYKEWNEAANKEVGKILQEILNEYVEIHKETKT